MATGAVHAPFKPEPAGEGPKKTDKAPGELQGHDVIPVVPNNCYGAVSKYWLIWLLYYKVNIIFKSKHYVDLTVAFL